MTWSVSYILSRLARALDQLHVCLLHSANGVSSVAATAICIAFFGGAAVFPLVGLALAAIMVAAVTVTGFGRLVSRSDSMLSCDSLPDGDDMQRALRLLAFPFAAVLGVACGLLGRAVI